MSIFAVVASVAVMTSPVTRELEIPEHGTGACNTQHLQRFMGQIATKALVTRLTKKAGAARSRVVRPGMMVTMDYRMDRLNVRVGKSGRIIRLTCG